MVGPLSDDQRRLGARRLQIGFVLLVGVSAGLISLQADPTPLQVAAAVLGGLALGVLLVAYLYRMGGSSRTRR